MAQEPETISLSGDGDATSSKPPASAQRKRSRPKPKDVSPETLNALHEKLAGNSYMVIRSALPVAPTVDELDGVFIPLERIGLRNAPEPMKNATPDQRDAFAALSSFARYAVRGYIVPALLSFLNRRQTPQGAAHPTSHARPPMAQRDKTPAEAASAAAPASPPIPPDVAAPKRAPKGKPPAPEGLKAALDPTQQPESQLAGLHEYLVATTPETGD